MFKKYLLHRAARTLVDEPE